MEKNHLEIILEDMNGKFKLVLEGHQVLRNDISRLHEELSGKIEDNSLAINALNGKVDRINEDLGGRIEALDSRLSARIDNLDSSLNARIDKVNDNLGAKIDAVADDLKRHREDTEMHMNYRVSEGQI